MILQTKNPAAEGCGEPGYEKQFQKNNTTEYSGKSSNNSISVFQGTNPKPIEETTWAEVVEQIQSEKHSQRLLVEEIRKTPNQAARKALKVKLQAYTFSGSFSHRKNANISTTTGFIIIDLDHLPDVAGLMNLLRQDPFVWFAFVSPSGDGIKVGIRTNGIKNDADHKKLFAAVERYFLEVYGLTIDPACKDIARLTFTSFDPGAFINKDAEYFDVKAWTPQPEEKPQDPIELPSYIKDNWTDTSREKYGAKVLKSCCAKIRQSPEHHQHVIRLQQARLIGGYVSSGVINESEALAALERAAADSGAVDMKAAMQTIKDGIENGKASPLYPDENQRNYSHNCTERQPDEDWNPDIKPWPKLDPIVFRGIAERFVELACRKSEADPVAVLITFLVRIGVEIGRKPFVRIGDTPHYLNLMAVIVGQTSKARKGTSAAPIQRLISHLIRTFCNTQDTENRLFSHTSLSSYSVAKKTPGPLSTGEGLIWAVRDPIEQWTIDKKTKEGEMQVIDPGIEDKRLYVEDQEFASALKCTKREGNTLATGLRCLWDDGTAEPLTKSSRQKTTGAHIGIITHITNEELLKSLDEVEAFTGFSNRFLWFLVRRQGFEPFPEPMPENKLHAIAADIFNIVNFFNEETEVKLSEPARQYWAEIYQDLSTGYPGFVGGVLNRAEAQVTRLSLLYACLDMSGTIEPVHIKTALALWRYVEQSAFYIFGGTIDPTEQKILDTLADGPKTGTELYKAFANKIDKIKLTTAINSLLASKKIITEEIATGGRPLKKFYLSEIREIREISNKSNTYTLDKARNKYEERSQDEEINVFNGPEDISEPEDTVIF
ncbi:hypothetical protein KAH55_03365 [bacterium]|nr:hypothetical protein [bacterium]